MNEINDNLISEIKIILFAEKSEFKIEKTIINDLIYPNLRNYFFNELNIDFNLIDLDQDTVENDNFLISVIEKCQTISNGLSAVFLIGDQYGELKAPNLLTSHQFQHVLNLLQLKNDSSSTIFEMKYSHNGETNEYVLNENIDEEENYSILNSIEAAIGSGNDIFPSSFIYEHFTSRLEKCLTAALKTPSTSEKTQIIHRSLINPLHRKESRLSLKAASQIKIKEKYDNLIKLIRRRMSSENYLTYSVSKAALLEADRDVTANSNMLSKLFSKCKFITNKCRSLTKDLKINSTSDYYIQVFIENVVKILRDNTTNMFLKKEFPKSSVACEIAVHKSNNIVENETNVRDLFSREQINLVNSLKKYLELSTNKTPCLLFGTTGSGKSTLLSELCIDVGKLENRIVIVRRCGKTVGSSSLQLILPSITYQIISSFSKSAICSQSFEYAVCVYEFWQSLNKYGKNKSIIILLDDVDKLFPSTLTYFLKWLPQTLPDNVKVILTSSSEFFYQGFKRRYDCSNIINIPMIDSREAIKFFNNYCQNLSKNPIDEKVVNHLNFILQENSTPLFLSLLFLTVDSMNNTLNITSDITCVIRHYFQKLERSHNPLLFIHTVSYLSLSRHGLSFAELFDILSLDNKLLDSFQSATLSKTDFTFQAVIVEKLLKDCEHLLEYVQTNRRLLIRLKHEIYKSTVIEHYRLLNEDGKYFLQTMYDYWTSKYDNVTPINDNKVLKTSILSQPYYTIGNLGVICSNERKLIELPFLLTTFDKCDELYKMVLFNFQYLFATLHHFGMNHLINEIYFARQFNDIKVNKDVDLLLVVLRLLPAEVMNDAKLLSVELTGRLSHLVGINTLFSHLILNTDVHGSQINRILSPISIYDTIDIENFSVQMGSEVGIVLSTLSSNDVLIATIHFQKPLNEVIITVWDSRKANKSQIINLGKMPNTKLHNAFYVPQRHDLLIVSSEDLNIRSFLIINLEFSIIEHVIKISNKNSIELHYATRSHLYLLINNQVEVFAFSTGEKDQNFDGLPWPTILSPNDKYLIGLKPPTKKPISNDIISFNLRIIHNSSTQLLSQLVLNTKPFWILVNTKNEIVYVSSTSYGIIYIYDISQIGKKNVSRIDCCSHLKLSDQSSLDDVIKELIEKYSSNFKTDKLVLSINEKFLLSEYTLGDSVRIIAVWNMFNKSIVLCNKISFTDSVFFSTDGQYICCFSKNGCLRVVNLSNGIDHIFHLDKTLRNIFMLKSGNFFLVYPNTIRLINLKTLVEKYKNCGEKNMESKDVYMALPKPKICSESAIIFSNVNNASTFSYFNLINNSVSKFNVSHTDKSLTEFAFNRFLSPDGKILLLAYKSKLTPTRKSVQDEDIDALMLKNGANGLLISSIYDYRKPQLPGENYFLGKNFDKNEDEYIFNQQILRIINLNSTKTIVKVSLVGETVLLITNEILLTLKSDHSNKISNTVERFDIVNIYHMKEGKFVSSLYLEHPVVDCFIIAEGEKKLLICCGNNGKLIKILGGKYFSKVILDMDIQSMLKYYDEFARSSVVTKVFVFENTIDSVLIQHSWLDHNSNIIKIDKENHYTTINLLKKSIICQFSSIGKVVSVSCDGSMAIDSLLNVYDLSKGNVIRKFQKILKFNTELLPNDCTCLFSKDSSYIYILDSVRGNLWMFTNDEKSLLMGHALIISGDNNNNNESNKLFQMCIRLHGRLIIIYNEQEFKLFSINLNSESITMEESYKSNIDRIKALLYSR